MIVWRGFGFLVAVFVFGAALLCNLAFDAVWGAGYYSSHKWTIGIAMFIAAVPSWVVGNSLRNRSKHSLFFIPMHYWGGILFVIGVVLCIMEFIN